MKINKVGFNGIPSNSIEKPVSKYKTYKYTSEDYLQTSYKTKTPVAYIEGDREVALTYDSGLLTIDNQEYDVSHLTIGEFLKTLRDDYGFYTYKLSEDSNNLLNLPSSFLNSFTNTFVTTLNGLKSPLLCKRQKNLTIESVEDVDVSTVVYDFESEKRLFYKKDDLNNIYFNCGTRVKIHIKTVSKRFYIFLDNTPKTILNGTSVSNLLGYMQK